MADDTIRPFRIAVSDDELADLKHRLKRTRWPTKEPVSDWSQGAPLHAVKELCEYWETEYDWRRCEDLMNSWPQFMTTIDDVDVYFIHIKSKCSGALPLLLTHGWPGSVLEFRKVIEPLTDAGDGESFDLIIPSLPGYGFSSIPKTTGYGFVKIASMWTILMERLGYTSWVAQGGDWGADVVAALGHLKPQGLLAGHVNVVFFNASKEISQNPTDLEKFAKAKQDKFIQYEKGYYIEQSTKPQTLGYSLADSPTGLAAWIFEKFHGWTQNDGDVYSVVSKDIILDNIMLYWLTNTITSSTRLYWEGEDRMDVAIDIPFGVSQFPGDEEYAPREWCEKYWTNIVHWRDVEKGGHFAALEQPEIFVREVRDCFRHVRQTA